MANHQCNPKAMYVPYFSERSFKIDARAQTDIKAGQEITVRQDSFLSLLMKINTFLNGISIKLSS